MNKQEYDNALDLLTELQHELKIWQESACNLEKALKKNDAVAAIKEVEILGKIDDATLSNICFDLRCAVFKAYPMPVV